MLIVKSLLDKNQTAIFTIEPIYLVAEKINSVHESRQLYFLETFTNLSDEKKTALCLIMADPKNAIESSDELLGLLLSTRQSSKTGVTEIMNVVLEKLAIDRKEEAALTSPLAATLSVK